jgi:hypothetical protein
MNKLKNTRLSEIMTQRWQEHREEMLKICVFGGKSGKGGKKPVVAKKLKGHVNFYSPESMGKERFDAIEKSRRLKISQNSNIEACKRGAEKGHETRRSKPNFGYSEEALKRQSATMSKNRKNGVCRTWNLGLTKYDDPRIMRHSLNKKIHFDKPERCRFTKDIRKAVGIRDNFECQGDGEHNGELVIHHKDINPMNNDLGNLVLLCRGCHAGLHLKMAYALNKR